VDCFVADNLVSEVNLDGGGPGVCRGGGEGGG